MEGDRKKGRRQGKDPRLPRITTTFTLGGKTVEKPAFVDRGEQAWTDAELFTLRETGDASKVLTRYRTDRLRLAYLNAVHPQEGMTAYTDKLFEAANKLSAPGLKLSADKRATILTAAEWLAEGLHQFLVRDKRSFEKAAEHVDFLACFALFVDAFSQVLQLTKTDRYKIADIDEALAITHKVGEAVQLLRDAKQGVTRQRQPRGVE